MKTHINIPDIYKLHHDGSYYKDRKVRVFICMACGLEIQSTSRPLSCPCGGKLKEIK